MKLRVFKMLIAAVAIVFIVATLLSGATWPLVVAMWKALLALVLANNPVILLLLAVFALATIWALRRW